MDMLAGKPFGLCDCNDDHRCIILLPWSLVVSTFSTTKVIDQRNKKVTWNGLVLTYSHREKFSYMMIVDDDPCI